MPPPPPSEDPIEPRFRALVEGSGLTIHIGGQRAFYRVRLHEKGGKLHTMPCHHALEDALQAYVDGSGPAGEPVPLAPERYWLRSGPRVRQL